MNPWLKIIALLCLFLPAPQALAFTRELTASELQTQLAGQFPRHEQTPFMTVTLYDPRIILKDKSDRIGLEISIATTSLGNVSGKARGVMDGKLHYESKTGEFFLLRPQMQHLHVAGVPEQYQGDIQILVETIARETLSQIPVYTLNEDVPNEALARSFLKSVAVRNGKLILELGLF
jgi:hypothetical protein